MNRDDLGTAYYMFQKMNPKPEPCPDCNVKPMGHGSNDNFACFWWECPKCGIETHGRMREDEAIGEWNTLVHQLKNPPPTE